MGGAAAATGGAAGASQGIGASLMSGLQNQMMSNPLAQGISYMESPGGSFAGGLRKALDYAIDQSNSPEEQRRRVQLLQQGEQSGLGASQAAPSTYNALMTSPEWEQLVSTPTKYQQQNQRNF